MVGLRMIHLPNDPLAIWNTIMVRKSIHLGFPHHANPLESTWYTWPVLYHPLVIKSARFAGQVRLASSVAHPLLTAAADVALVALPVLASAAALSERWRERWKRWFDGRSTKAVAILVASWVSTMLLWMSGQIVTYWYHYLTSWGFAIMLVGGLVSLVDRRHPKVVLVFVSAVLTVSVYFAPVWAELPVSQATANRCLPFPLWR
jgi:dolichyl-phosphate-mannose--protein O-mannosyl transferase